MRMNKKKKKKKFCIPKNELCLHVHWTCDVVHAQTKNEWLRDCTHRFALSNISEKRRNKLKNNLVFKIVKLTVGHIGSLSLEVSVTGGGKNSLPAGFTTSLYRIGWNWESWVFCVSKLNLTSTIFSCPAKSVAFFSNPILCATLTSQRWKRKLKFQTKSKSIKIFSTHASKKRLSLPSKKLFQWLNPLLFQLFPK